VALVFGLVALGLGAEPRDPKAGLAQPDPFSTKIWDDFSLTNLAVKGHQAGGYATLTLGASAFAFEAAGRDDGPVLRQAAAGAAAFTLVAGLVGHWGQLSFDGDLATWNNLHALTGSVGGSLVLAAPWAGSGRTAAGLGLAGTLLLALAVVLEG